MKKRFEAFLREENSLRELAMTDAGKPAVDPAFALRWQSKVNALAMQANPSVALILQVRQTSIGVLLASDTAGQANLDPYLANGLYCKAGSGHRGLLIANRASSEFFSGNLTGMSSIPTCFGLPVQWPDEELFGVVCVLHYRGKTLKPACQNLLAGLREAMEQELVALTRQSELPQAPQTVAAATPDEQTAKKEPVALRDQEQPPQTSDMDALTSIYSRKKIEEILKREFERAKRYFKTFSVTMIDLNGLQKINDSFGVGVGDDVLKAFAQSVASKIRETDSLGRWGGDAFILVCPYADTVETQQMVARIRPLVNREMKAAEAFSDFSFGVSQYEPEDLTYQAIVKRAEENMRQYKEMISRKSFAATDGRNANSR